jgi:hypothetical protein
MNARHVRENVVGGIPAFEIRRKWYVPYVGYIWQHLDRDQVDTPELCSNTLKSHLCLPNEDAYDKPRDLEVSTAMAGTMLSSLLN